MRKLAPAQAPADLNEHLQSTPRNQAIDEHGFELNLSLWNNRIGHLPGAPVRGINGDTERGIISRGSLFAMADAACEDKSNEAAYALLWHTLVWGTGTNHRNTPQRSGYGYNTYSTAIGLMAEWAGQLSTAERRVGFDEVERWAFKVA